MNRFFLLLILFSIPNLLPAQKNVVPVTQTQLLGLKLPEGSKQDKRMISVNAAKALLEIETKAQSKNVVTTEVYYLPAVSQSGYNAESLVKAITVAGYQLREVPGDKKFVWAEKGSQSLMVYFSVEQNQTELYIGECNPGAPVMQSAPVAMNTNSGQAVKSPAGIPPLLGRQTGGPQTKSAATGNEDFVYDLDGNRYTIIKIGNDFWTKENLRTTQYNDTTPIASGAGQEWSKLKHGAYSVYDDKPANKEKYGLLYNGYAAASGKLCPEGWHVATDKEWKELEKFYGIPEGELDRTGERGNIADKLKVPEGWNASTFSGNNSSGFSILPAGSRLDNGEYSNLGQYGNFWTSTVYDNRYGLLYLWNHHVHYNTNAVGRIYTVAQNGYSCRCVKDKK